MACVVCHIDMTDWLIARCHLLPVHHLAGILPSSSVGRVGLQENEVLSSVIECFNIRGKRQAINICWDNLNAETCLTSTVLVQINNVQLSGVHTRAIMDQPLISVHWHRSEDTAKERHVSGRESSIRDTGSILLAAVFLKSHSSASSVLCHSVDGVVAAMCALRTAIESAYRSDERFVRFVWLQQAKPASITVVCLNLIVSVEPKVPSHYRFAE